jgi:hypothetical protein
MCGWQRTDHGGTKKPGGAETAAQFSFQKPAFNNCSFFDSWRAASDMPEMLDLPAVTLGN